jgi:hypothetical protein
MNCRLSRRRYLTKKPRLRSGFLLGLGRGAAINCRKSPNRDFKRLKVSKHVKCGQLVESPSSVSLWRIFPGKVETVLQLSQAARGGFRVNGDALMTSTVCEIVLLTWLLRTHGFRAALISLRPRQIKVGSYARSI